MLSGGRMKAGGVLFADTPDEAAAAAEKILRLEINGHKPRGVLVESRQPVAQEYYLGVTWDGIAKRPVMILSDMGGIDVEEVAEKHPEHIAKRHFSTLLPFSEYRAKQLVAQLASGSDVNAIIRFVAPLARIFMQYGLTLAEINPLAKLADGSFVALDAHVDMEAEVRSQHAGLLARARDRRRRDAHGARADQVRARRRRDQRGRSPRRRGQRDRVRRHARPDHRRGRRLAHALRRGAESRRRSGELLRDRRQPERRARSRT